MKIYRKTTVSTKSNLKSAMKKVIDKIINDPKLTE